MRILIVEDDRKLADFVARGLRAERFAVDLAGSGREGMAPAKSRNAFPVGMRPADVCGWAR